MVSEEIIHLQDEIIPFDSSKGCTIEQAKSVYQFVCRTGAQKMNASIEFGCYLEYLYQSFIQILNSKLGRQFLKNNGFCQKTQAKLYFIQRKFMNFYQKIKQKNFGYYNRLILKKDRKKLRKKII